jgi:feruloyl esterase
MSVIERMGQHKVDEFARFFVIPQANHGLAGTNYPTDADGKAIPAGPIPNTYDQLPLLMDWVERKIPPARQLTVTAGDRSLPLCSYPLYPKYTSGPPASAESYTCAR